MIETMPPLQWLLTFQAVMDAGSFAGAAKALNLTPSAISHQMRALEGRLGQALFLRERRSVTPTEEAITYSASIAESFARLATATNRLVAGAGMRRLPIHASPSFATLWLTPRIGEFMREHPSIDVSLFASHEPARLGQDGILIDIQYARPAPENCEAIPLCEESITPLASPRFIAEHGVADVSAIARVPLIRSLRCAVPWEEWSARHAPRTPLNPRGPHFDRAHLSLAAAADGLGLVLESTFQGASRIRSGDLVAPFADRQVPVVAHRLVFRREHARDPEVAAFTAWITRAMAAQTPQHRPGPA
jgi:LysR family transcriptional regulator, glycine cleavage system transcriptional activator